ncbi:MAG: hypothetical protein VX421_07450, partial [Pseudomonadota bacterium]|nr:hypothetical protein [Pseudomonadota bacterium]
CYSFLVARFSKVLFWACVAAAVLGFYTWLGSVFWPLYFPALELHIWLGIGVVLGSSPALAWHLRKSRSRLVPTLLVPAAVLALLAVIITGRPEYPAFGPIGWAAGTTSAQLLITALFMRFMSGDGTSVRTSISGVVVTVVLLYGLHAGIFGWLMRGDERWGPMIAHSILGVFTSLLLLAHLPKVRDILPGKRGPLLLLVSSLAVVAWWYQSYPHDLVLGDFGSPMDFADGPTFAPPERHWDTPIGVMPRTREERAQGPLEPLDPAVIGDSASCGAAGCHPAITAQWAGSSHRYSADNAFYAKVVSLLVEERGVEEAAWCAACHDPVRVLAGTVE